MDLVIITLIIVVVWIGLLVVVLAICRASAHADADEERYLAEGCDDVSSQPVAPRFDDDRKSIDRADLDREAERLRIELPDRPRLRLTRLVGTRRPRS